MLPTLNRHKASAAGGHSSGRALALLLALVQHYTAIADMLDSMFATVFCWCKSVALAQWGYTIVL